MRSRLGMFAYYQKKEGGGQDLSPCPGGSGTNTLTYLAINPTMVGILRSLYHRHHSLSLRSEAPQHCIC